MRTGGVVGGRHGEMSARHQGRIACRITRTAQSCAPVLYSSNTRHSDCLLPPFNPLPLCCSTLFPHARLLLLLLLLSPASSSCQFTIAAAVSVSSQHSGGGDTFPVVSSVWTRLWHDALASSALASPYKMPYCTQKRVDAWTTDASNAASNSRATTSKLSSEHTTLASRYNSNSSAKRAR